MNAQDYDYSKIDSVKMFSGTHPLVMKNRITSQNWKINLDIKHKNYSCIMYLLSAIEKLTGWRIGEYKNYKII
ncbi:hypothetical protein SDC9_136544 [bioreactor metagenome]|uniref:Uncharacterized protein n=1 Tax=bioreactor metagenome TaxID=1076179 RepID=A0A645DJJ4_9ZZZZ